MFGYAIYYETCNNSSMISHPFFTDKLNLIESITVVNPDKYHRQILAYNKLLQTIYPRTIAGCSNCAPSTYYLMGNIFWSDSLRHMMDTHHLYPSDYFIKTILASDVADGSIINPPIIVPRKSIPKFKYIPLRRNKLLILDALMNQGSYPRYQNGADFLFSEHSGVVTVKNYTIDDIVIFTNTDRIDKGDDRIFLPQNTHSLSKFEYLFHTHPKAITYGGRIKDGILYEFPSAGDIFNFVKYHSDGKALASIVVAPEGAYVIRQLRHQKTIDVDPSLFYQLKKFIIKLEKMAIKKYRKAIPQISDPDHFHQNIASDYEFIKLYNKFIKPINLVIEYYPREKVNGEWSLRQFYLQYI